MIINLNAHDNNNIALVARNQTVIIMVVNYKPPCTITPAIILLISEISETIGRLTSMESVTGNLRLRRINRIRTIQGSLAIEGNTLTIEQITAILEGKRVIAPPREIQEVRNAIATYDQIDKWNPQSLTDLLDAHRVLMMGLVDAPGVFRSGGVGVMDGETVVHMAPPSKKVHALMNDLFGWLTNSEHHPLIASSIFHYEFEFIHPFTDGNGRMGRLWQTLIMNKWNTIFANIPVESIVHEHQSEYYDALNKSTQQGESSIFVEFMLGMILDALKSATTPEVTPDVTPEVKKMISVMKGEQSRSDLQRHLKLSDEKNFREKYLVPALKLGVIERTIPNKPNSRLQKYRITRIGTLIAKK